MSAAARRIGRIIRSNREHRGLSQEALAELADLNRSYIGEIERGSAVPSLDTLQKIADAFGEKLSKLIEAYEQIED